MGGFEYACLWQISHLNILIVDEIWIVATSIRIRGYLVPRTISNSDSEMYYSYARHHKKYERNQLRFCNLVTE